MAERRLSEHSSSFWFFEDENDKHDALFEYVQTVEEAQRHVRGRNVAHAQLYSNRYEPGMATGDEHYRDSYEAITDNIIKSMVDTATSLQGTGRIKPSFLTDAADWDYFQLAEDLEKVTWGLWSALEINAKRTRKFRDSGIFGTGGLRVLTHDGRICVERVIIDDIVVDEAAVPSSGELPRQLTQIRFVAREVLRARFCPEGEDNFDLEQKIDSATGGWRKLTDWRGTAGADMVMVLESWHLESAPGRGDGRYVMAIDTATLVDESYEKSYYPFVFFHYDEPVTGFYGTGIAELLLGHQIRLNELHDFKRRAQDLMSVPRWWMNSSSRVNSNVFINEIGIIGEYIGNTPPVSVAPQAVNAEIYQEEARIEESAMKRAGISAMAANATNVPGVEHAVALRELSDSQARRHIERTARFEDSAIQLVKLIIHALKDLVESGADLSKYPEREIIESIDWDLVNLFEPTFTIQIQTASMMSETPAGRHQEVMERLQYGGFEFLGGGDARVGMQEAAHLLGHPDTNSNRLFVNAARTRIDWVIRKMREGEQILPEPDDDLMLGIERVTAAKQVYEVRNCPDEILENFRVWVEQAQQMLQQSMAAQIPAAPVANAEAPIEDPLSDPALMAA